MDEDPCFPFQMFSKICETTTKKKTENIDQALSPKALQLKMDTWEKKNFFHLVASF